VIFRGIELKFARGRRVRATHGIKSLVIAARIQPIINDRPSHDCRLRQRCRDGVFKRQITFRGAASRKADERRGYYIPVSNGKFLR